MRTISEQERLSLKKATQGAYTLAGGNTCILPFTRAVTSSLSKYASESDEWCNYFIPLDIAVEVDRRLKSPLIIKVAAEILGYKLSPIQSSVSEDAQPSPVTESDATRVMKETMDVAQAIIEARKDNKIDAADRKILLKELNEAIQALEEVKRAVEVEL